MARLLLQQAGCHMSRVVPVGHHTRIFQMFFPELRPARQSPALLAVVLAARSSSHQE